MPQSEFDMETYLNCDRDCLFCNLARFLRCKEIQEKELTKKMQNIKEGDDRYGV